MYLQHSTDINSFFIAGISYKNTDTATRGRFAVGNEQYEAIIHSAKSHGITELFVLSTCNRTEIYGFAPSVKQLISMLCAVTEGTAEEFKSVAYQKSGNEAIEHLFNVAGGLDSQILGDYEIVGQLKAAVKFSKERNCIGVYLDRLLNEVLQATRKIRSNTALSSGTVSVSFAALQYLKTNGVNLKDKKILLLGTGKIGTNLCKNIADQLPGADVTVINRSPEKALALSLAYPVKAAPIEMLSQFIRESHIILVATNALHPVIFAGDVKDAVTEIVIDLSVPCNVDQSVKEINNIQLVNVDELSRIKDETLQKRAEEVPMAKKIIAAQVSEFLDWHRMRRNAPVLKDIKNKLHSFRLNPSYSHCYADQPATMTEEKVQQVINGMAQRMRTQNDHGCICINAINDFISTATY